jgi:nicotinate phosphoribosyltransferase
MKFKESLLAEGALYADFYQLTMAQVYFQLGIHEKTSQFDYFFRSYPDYGLHQAGYCIHAGMEWFLDWMEDSYFLDPEIDYLRTLKTQGGDPLFSKEFLEWLKGKNVATSLSIQAIPEGRVVHPYVPLAVVQGPLLFAQFIESSLLNHLNYQTLIATKAARIQESSQGQAILEFGLRRAQDRAATAGARAAIIGGAVGTSNTGASAILGFRPTGTHAHSLVQAVVAMGGSELDAFREYATTFPDDCTLLVDTYDTLESGVPNAIKIFEELKAKGHKPLGIRLDSGDLAYLSIQAARKLNDAGFEDVRIVLSNEIDELVIWQILTQIKEEAGRYGVDPDKLIKRLVYGVGTRMITSSVDPALDGVYKLVAINENKGWIPAIKISENPEKTLNPGHKHIWRIYDDRDKAIADVLSTEDENLCEMQEIHLYHPTDQSKHRILSGKEKSRIEPLLEDVMKDGKVVCDLPSLEKIRGKREEDMQFLYPGVKRIMNPHHYHVSLTEKLWSLKQNLVKEYSNGEKDA